MTFLFLLLDNLLLALLLPRVVSGEIVVGRVSGASVVVVVVLPGRTGKGRNLGRVLDLRLDVVACVVVVVVGEGLGVALFTSLTPLPLDS